MNNPIDQQKVDEVIAALLNDARQRMERIAKNHDMTYTDFMAAADSYQAYEEYHHIGVDIDYDEFDEAFWRDWESLSPGKERKRGGSFFTCSC